MVACVVCDALFALPAADVVVTFVRASLQALELVKHTEQRGFKIPKVIASMALHLVRNSVKARAKFDIFDVKPIQRAHEAFIPAFFMAAEVRLIYPWC